MPGIQFDVGEEFGKIVDLICKAELGVQNLVLTDNSILPIQSNETEEFVASLFVSSADDIIQSVKNCERSVNIHLNNIEAHFNDHSEISKSTYDYWLAYVEMSVKNVKIYRKDAYDLSARGILSPEGLAKVLSAVRSFRGCVVGFNSAVDVYNRMSGFPLLSPTVDIADL